MAAEKPHRRSYIDAYIQFSDRIERYMRYALLALAALLVACQAMLHIPELRPYLTTVDRLEGERLDGR